MNATARQIITRLDAVEFLCGQWHRQPAEIGFQYIEQEFDTWTSGQLRSHAQFVANQLPEQNA